MLTIQIGAIRSTDIAGWDLAIEGHKKSMAPKEKTRDKMPLVFSAGGPCGARTHDPRIKSPMLYQLS